MDLSIIIPVWNEASKIVDDIQEVAHFSENFDGSVELIIVDDGSDDLTLQLARDISVPAILSKKLIGYRPHRGKGHAVKRGVINSKGDLVMFMDSGRNVPLEYIHRGIKKIKHDECDVLMGSRYLPGSVIRIRLIWYRQITSLWFRKVVKWYFQLPSDITDTQCGFKIFRGDIARNLFHNCGSDGFIFDLEIILTALKNKYRLCELPIEWSCDRDTRLSLIHSIIPVIKDLRKLKRDFL